MHRDWENQYYYGTITVSDLISDCEELYPDGITCELCGRKLGEDEQVITPLSSEVDYSCEDCGDKALKEERVKAEAWAKEHCKLTSQPHVYEPEYRWAPTPDEYESGNREAYTENSVNAGNRHSCTNYEALLKEKNLSKFDDDEYSKLWYFCIRDRIDDILDEYEPPDEPIDDED